MMTRADSSRVLVSDVIAFALLALITFGLWRYSAEYQQVSGSHPLLVGFLVFACLSMFGEGLSQRLSGGGWVPAYPLRRTLLWGALGVWISVAFPFQFAGATAITSLGIWPDAPLALTTSLWANVLSGYAFFMMLSHLWADTVITRGWRAPWAIFDEPHFGGWAKTVLCSLVLFWLPAHTITFMLPPDFRSVFAAYLGIALGVILTTARLRAQRTSLDTNSAAA